MSREAFRRLMQSLGLGAAIPSLYFILLMLFFGGLSELGFAYQTWFEYVSLPVGWASDLYAHFFGYQDMPVYNFFRPDVWLAGIIGNWIVYTLLSYLFLRRRDALRLR